MPERRYDEKELALILRAAATAQAEGAGPGDDAVGFTIDEIQRLAAEVGIDPRHVALAAERLAEGANRSKRFHFFGAPTTEMLDRSFDGVLDDEAWEDMVTDLRAVFGSEGSTNSNGSTREWRGGTDTVSGHCSALVRDGKTKIRLTVNRSGGLFMGWGVGGTLAFVACLILIIALNHAGAGLFDNVMYLAITLAISYGIVRAGITRWAGKIQGQVGPLMDRLRLMATQHATQCKTGIESVDQSLPDRLNQKA